MCRQKEEAESPAKTVQSSKDDTCFLFFFPYTCIPVCSSSYPSKQKVGNGVPFLNRQLSPCVSISQCQLPFFFLHPSDSFKPFWPSPWLLSTYPSHLYRHRVGLERREGSGRKAQCQEQTHTKYTLTGVDKKRYIFQIFVPRYQ